MQVFQVFHYIVFIVSPHNSLFSAYTYCIKMTKLLIKKYYFVPIFVASIASIRYSSQWFMFVNNGLHCPSLISNFPPKKVPGGLPGDSISAKFDFKVGFCNKLSCQDAAFPRFWPLPASLVYIETLCGASYSTSVGIRVKSRREHVL